MMFEGLNLVASAGDALSTPEKKRKEKKMDFAVSPNFTFLSQSLVESNSNSSFELFSFVKNKERPVYTIPTDSTNCTLAISLAIRPRQLATFGEGVRLAILLIPRAKSLPARPMLLHRALCRGTSLPARVRRCRKSVWPVAAPSSPRVEVEQRRQPP
jgi:hypothetical protein